MSLARLNLLQVQAPAALARIERRSLAIGALAAVACVVGLAREPQQFFHSYLIAYMLWIGITVGCLAVLMLHHLTGGQWGIVIRRTLEAASATVFPFMLILFLPFIFGMRHLYIWADPVAAARDELLRHKHAYLNVGAFWFRAGIYFLTWALLSRALLRWSSAQDRQPESGALMRRFQGLAGPGLVLYGLTITFATVDWVMSLSPHWSSTIFGLLFIAGEVLAALAFVIAMTVLLSHYQPLAQVLRPDHLQDLGKLMLTFVMLWAYMAFSQFLIIWSENLTDENPWYLDRLRHGWQFIGLALALFHFALPFALLLSRNLKRSRHKLAWLAGFVLVMRWVDLVWMIEPNFRPPVGLHISWMDVVAPLALGGLWMSVFFRYLRSRPLLPVNDPELVRILEAQHATA